MELRESGVIPTTALYTCPASKRPVCTSTLSLPFDIVTVKSSVESPVFVRENEMLVCSFIRKSPANHNFIDSQNQKLMVGARSTQLLWKQWNVVQHVMIAMVKI